ncbi:MAG: SDR family oxidoreductase [Planctomycetes bacterium]|nr:SDR family oxidoreductase [Planctomycetota bacterium]
MKNYREIFNNKIALVTGGAKRLGCAIATELARQGCHVIVQYRKSDAEAHALVKRLKEKFGIFALSLKADLSQAEEVEGLLYRAVDASGPIDYLVNNASVFLPSLLDNITFSDIADAMQVNAYAPLQLSRVFAQQRNPGAAILNLLDTRIHGYDREHAAYHLSKRALFSLTKMMAEEYAPYVRVNGLAPGLILPPPEIGDNVHWLEVRRNTNPLNAYGSIDDVSDAAIFLLSSDFITGEVLHVDGGRHLRSHFYE